MKLLRYGDAGQEKPGLLDVDGNIRDLSRVVDDIDTKLLSDFSVLNNVNIANLPVVSGEPRIGAPVSGVGKVIGIGLNYSDHAEEAGMDVPSEPIMFMKATSSICGPNDPVIIPRGSEKTDWEVELGVIIGKGGKYIEEKDALDAVAGYCVINDVSERAFQIERQGTWDKGKSADHFCPMGPWLVTVDEIGDPQNKDLWLDLNGIATQRGNTNKMVYGVTYVVSYLSQFMTLHPGDVIATGTPPGVGMGMKPPMFLKVGDVLELGVEGLGRQRQDVIAD
ncbi:fumarylacetoacetate hydrolase family protein [Curvivirga aplysinae]|uniref:fumarylacetoacetate hydrolase family protein n=1 Tax=Curvivirga aplysinae TaxID=2529852 RepID=UPI0012BC5576|nr:fumarylacetoacetate hydrolase family protein [Curvivirga aplysinae]MTI10756.1 FAA hydrolase family protein [Curvivirga aplysinae]